MSELLTVSGVTVSGTQYVELAGDLIYSGAFDLDYIRIPKGMKAKIWAKTLTGTTGNISVVYTHLITTAGGTAAATFITLERESYDSAVDGTLNVEKRRPIVARGFTGNEAIAFENIDDTDNTYISYEIELCEDN